MNILLLGAGGQVGVELQPVLGALGRLTALTRAELDLRDAGALRACIETLRPDVLVNAAAYTAVDRAETEPEEAFRVNAQAVGEMARCMRALDGLLVHYSTDYVFDGSATRPYVEEDVTGPLNRYGHSKLAGEVQVQASGVRHFIFRTSWIYAHHGHNFLRTMLRLAADHDTLRVVCDQTGAPTWARQVAQATGQVLAQSLPVPAASTQWRQWSGTYHLSATGSTTWHGFASEIMRLRQVVQKLASPRVEAITSAQFPSTAPRPAWSLLDNGKLRRQFGLQPEHWTEALKRCMALLPV